MGYRGCLGVIRLAGKYSHARMEAAAERALLTGACRYRSIEQSRFCRPTPSLLSLLNVPSLRSKANP
jgi:hypothetical protein